MEWNIMKNRFARVMLRGYWDSVSEWGSIGVSERGSVGEEGKTGGKEDGIGDLIK